MKEMNRGLAALCAVMMSLAPVEVRADTERQGPNDELSCLARAIYFEARGEPVFGQVAVGRVILNRVASEAYPDSICAVVYENADRLNACQFSFACDGQPDRIRDHRSWGRILERAAILINGWRECMRGTVSTGLLSVSTHYHATYVSPRWADDMIRTGRIGRHLFFYEERVGGLMLAGDDVADRQVRKS